MPERGRAPVAFVPTGARAPRERARLREGDEAGRAGVSVAGLSGGVSYGRGGVADGWRPASVGLPVAKGDRLYAGRGGSLELESTGFAIRLASATGLEALELSDDVKRFYVWGGSASFVVRQLAPGESFGVESPNATVTFERAGDYRIDAGGEGDAFVVVDRGRPREGLQGLPSALKGLHLEPPRRRDPRLQAERRAAHDPGVREDSVLAPLLRSERRE